MDFQRKNLAKLSWTLAGWEANSWRMRRSMELDSNLKPEVGPCPARVPGSVNNALLGADLLPDWNQGLNMYACEWVEHRHWEFATRLPAAWFAKAAPARLVCQGLDHSGHVLVDGAIAGSFEGTLLPHVFDLSAQLTPGRAHTLSLIFEGAPAEQNQFGFTSRSRHFKPRFNYRWDWCPRIVTLGVWDAIRLEIGDQPRLDNVRPRATLAADLKTGACAVECRLWSGRKARVELKATLRREGKVLGEISQNKRLEPGEQRCTLRLAELQVEPWFPNGEGEQALYDLQVEVREASAQDQEPPADRWRGQVGFKRIQWRPCAGAPKDALPWICEINGRPVFLQGVNWTPIRPNYHDLTRADYAQRLRTYARMGCNIVRVWGGGLIERQEFYELCDQLGLLVWQEFPLSSSGIENTPPRDPESIAKLVRIAESAIERRDGHASMLIWCGGNELQSGPDKRDQAGFGWPWDETHPCLKALGDVVRRLHSPARFLPASPFGPAASADPAHFGQGRHHAVHGPWIVEGTMREWQDFWDREDSLFRSETGCPGASPLDLLEQHHGEQPLWPPSIDNPYWRYPGGWWAEWDRFGPQVAGLAESERLAQYIRLSQRHQAQALAYAARACKRRFPRCGGFIVWMGHDCFPCTANTSLLDFRGRPKPAARALARIFREPAERNPIPGGSNGKKKQ